MAMMNTVYAINTMTSEMVEFHNVVDIRRTLLNTTLIFEDGTLKEFGNFSWNIFHH